MTAALRRSVDLLDSGTGSASSASNPSQERLAQQIPVPGSDDADEDLEVLVAEGDHWLVNHGRRKLVRVHISERQGVLRPSESELPVDSACLGDRCRVVAFVRDGNKFVHEYDWRCDWVL